MTSSAPVARANLAFSSVETVAITRAPMLCAIWTSSDPTPRRRTPPRRFLSQNQRQWRLVTALAVVNVNKVDARRRDLHHGLVRFRLRNRQVHQFHHFRSARLLDLYSFHMRFR